ncbi:hypothetical protein TDB9533_03893 [Thalassocella blandensis]|nr:hypothetical protein TDB9533_03893 [Thalassocella blandensis]
MQILNTARTTIHAITEADADFFIALVNSPGWQQYINNPKVYNRDDALRYLNEGFLKSYTDHSFSYYLVRNLAGDAIGIGGFLKKAYLPAVDFGFALLPQYYNQGFALEFSRAILHFGVKTFGFDELIAVTSIENLRSQRLLEKLDFKYQEVFTVESIPEPLKLFRRLRVDTN